MLSLKSPVFKDNNFIPKKYTCDGLNISPPLIIEGVEENIISLCLIVDDPDAPGGDWVHWLVWNISPHYHSIPEGDVPINAIQGLNDFGHETYGGPCPPSGIHRYKFKLFGLDTNLDLTSTARKVDLEKAMKLHLLQQTILTGLYKSP